MSRIKKLQKLIPDSADCILVTSELNQRYLTGLKYTDGYVVVSREHAWLVADFRYIEEARRFESDELDVILLEGRKATLGGLFCDNKFGKIGFEGSSVTYDTLNTMRGLFPDLEFYPCGGIIEKLREVKAPDEIENIIKAQRIAEKALDRLFEFITPNMTEIDVALELEYGMKKFGAENIAFDTIAVSGSASSLPHGSPRNVKLEKGFLTMDFGALYNGYCSDMTRTVVIGKADREMKKIYNTVLDAQRAALEFTACGKKGNDCDKVARDIIYGSGYEGCFGHSLGHGVGMYIHEEPKLSFSFDKILPEGAVVTVEPGIYICGKYGVRIEDMVYLSKGKTVNLTLASKELMELF